MVGFSMADILSDRCISVDTEAAANVFDTDTDSENVEIPQITPSTHSMDDSYSGDNLSVGEPVMIESEGMSSMKKKRRVLFTKEMTLRLERAFHNKQYLSTQERDALAQNVGISSNQVKIWFQNQRYKTKKSYKERGFTKCFLDRKIQVPSENYRLSEYIPTVPQIFRGMNAPPPYEAYYSTPKYHPPIVYSGLLERFPYSGYDLRYPRYTVDYPQRPVPLYM